MDATYIGEVPPAPPRVSRSRQWLKRLAGLLLLLFLGLVGLYFLEAHWAEQQLQEAAAEAERLDPGWRWDELQAARVKLPAGQNSADQLLAARKLLGGSWPPAPPAPAGASAPEPQTLDQVLAKAPANVLLDEDFAAELGQELDRVAPGVVAARRLSELPQGRHPLVLAPDFVSTRMDSIQDARMIATLLRLDAARLSQEGNLDRALDSCRAAVNVGRSMNDELFLIALLVRCACLGQSLAALERTLANGEAGADGLRATQELLQLEERSMQPALLHALRGERAGGQQAIQFLIDGHVSLGQLADTRDDFWVDLLLRAHPGLLKRNQARYLSLCTELVELAKLPVQEQPAAVAAWQDRLQQLRVHDPYRSMLASLFLPSSAKTFTSVQRSQAKLRCASLALAAERFRQEQGRWPTALRELCPKYCPELPVDSFNGQPLRLKKTDEGLTIYSVGVDGSDNDGNVQHQGNQNVEGIDQGFRLWHVEQRRQPAN
jgi:hypothetical protein